MKKTASVIVSLGVAFIFLFPILWMLQASFLEESRIFQPGTAWKIDSSLWTLHHYADAWRRAMLGRALANSALQVILISGLGLIINAPAAYAFARLNFFGRNVLFGALVILIILPVEVLAVPMFLTARDLGLTGGYSRAMAGLTVPFLAKAFNIYFLRQHFLSIPVELEEAAVIDGAGVWRQFWNVALPAIRPALITVVLLDVLTHWSDFLWPLMISTREETRTVQLSLANLFTQPPIRWGDILACATVATLPVIALFSWFQHYMVPSETSVGIK
ncbi:MAG TPA: carbohydrate ABC transporter permease [Opitutaceae bacterium]|nr:carbohydrate ABC transporter permease [Opitutaceae bacterium]